jgi:pimeloyl-ACP methyl ester carboxylesterase
MSQWVREWQQLDLVSDCRTIAAPTLLVTGEASLDRVVPVTSTLDYLSLIPGSRHVTLAKTGHIGLVMRPEAFAKVIEDFSCI